MLEHLIYVNTWFPKYEVDLAEQTHYTVFVSIYIHFFIYMNNFIYRTKKQVIQPHVSHKSNKKKLNHQRNKNRLDCILLIKCI
jgi:hypothetical protein